jgi:hypothetical protein
MRRVPSAVQFLCLLLLQGSVRADDITGVQPAALDQPRIYMNLRREARGEVLMVKVDKESSGAIEAFLDTGASGIVLSNKTAKSLGIKHASTEDHKPFLYEDVGVGGAEQFQISEPLCPSFAPYSSNSDGDNLGAYGKPLAPIRLQIKPSEGLLDALTGGLDIAGMPAMLKKVVVIDARPVNTFTDKLKTSIVDPGDVSIPKTDRHVPLTYVSFARFTRLTPAGGPSPAIASNPMIGADPFSAHDKSQGVVLKYKGKSASVTMLLDTGAAASMISKKTAEALGVRYSDDESSLVGIPEKEQFTLTVGGIGGNKTASGFYLDLLALPARDGAPVRYAKAPVLVSDISVVDPKTHQTFTLDGVFGMNFLTATAEISGGLLPDIGKLTQGPFTFIVIDHAHGVLGLK